MNSYDLFREEEENANELEEIKRLNESDKILLKSVKSQRDREQILKNIQIREQMVIEKEKLAKNFGFASNWLIIFGGLGLFGTIIFFIYIMSNF